MTYKKYALFLIPVLTVFLNSCFKATEDAPAYVRINNFTLTTDSATQGSSSNRIIDGWVYMDGKLLGIFQLPTTIPVLAVGEHTFTINPGVLNSGVEAARLAYPFYESYIRNITFAQNGKVTVSPTTKYRSNIEFKLNEGFEQGVSFEKAPYGDTTMIQITDPSIVFEGKGCAGLILNGNKDTVESRTKNSYTFTLANNEIYLELNYNSNCDLDVGIAVEVAANYYQVQSISGFFSTGGVWKKTYVELSRTIHETYPSALSFKVYFRVTRSSLDTDSKVYLDNVKLVNTK